MKRFAAVALREFAERRLVLVAAACAAVIPFLVPLLPGVPSADAGLARNVATVFLAWALGLGGSLLIGASVVGRELAEKRLSFQFSRPLPAVTIWAGKIAGGLLLVLLAEALIVLPGLVANGRIPSIGDAASEAEVLRGLLLAPPILFLFAWVGSVALRSRSPWLVVDLVFLVTVPALLFVILLRLRRYGHAPEPSWALAAVGVLVGALLLATLAQVAAGRTDARRGHGAQSLALWATLLAATAVGAFQAERTIDPGVARLVRAWANPAGPGGDWVFVRGSVWADGAGSTSYLLNLKTRRSLLMPASWEATASVDGTRAVIVPASLRPFRELLELEAIDLNSGETASLDLKQWPDGLSLSADGRRLAVVSQGICSVLELPSFRNLASAKVPSARWAYEPLFVSPDLVRLHPRRNWRGTGDAAQSASTLEDPVAAELDVSKKTVATLATYPLSAIPLLPRKEAGVDRGPIFSLIPSPDLSRVLVVGFGTAHAVRLLEAASGRVLASADGSEETVQPTGYFLSDGRAIVSEPAPDGCRLVLFALDGTRQSEIALPAGTKHVRFGYEPAKGRLAIGLGRDQTAEKRDWVLADLASGNLEPMATEAIARNPFSGSDPAAPGSPATRLAYEKGTGRLVLYDPATGETKPLTRGRPGRK